mmetsp:Transcript_64030/g.111553  ORF Transcript_64030/g.111553 Transcript_64030/m.111553 type:complete len:423 (-) Transcript_64030:50-1318(-)
MADGSSKEKVALTVPAAAELTASPEATVELPHAAYAAGVWVAPEDEADAERATKDDAFAIARVAVQAALRRAEYEALKVLAWRFPHGTHVTAMSCAEDCKAEHHAVYCSSEEVIHKIPPSGTVVADTWFSFLMRFPKWRIIAWPDDSAHGDEIVKRARRRVGAEEGYSNLLGNNSERFVEECYTGTSSSVNADTLAVTASATAASAAAGAYVAAPYAVSTVTTYALGIIPWGTATVVSGSVIAAGAAVGAAVGATVLAPTYWYYRRSAKEASLGRLPFCIINQSSESVRVSTYKLSDTYRWVPVVGLAGQSAGNLAPQSLLELDPPEDSDEFQVEVAWQKAPTSTVSWVTSQVTSMVPRIFASEDLRAVVRRGSVYRLTEAFASTSSAKVPDEMEASTTKEAALQFELARVPRSVLPAYMPD